VASGLDPLRHDRSPAGVARAGRRLIQAYVQALPPRGRARAGGTVAQRLWPRLTARPADPVLVQALDTALVVLADHDLASSTYAVRVAASVRADPYSAAVTGLGAIGGPLHGAASAAVHELFDRAVELGSPGAAVGDLLRRDRPLPGFGHPVYHSVDPRYRLLQGAVTAAFGSDPGLEVVEAVTGVARSRRDDVANIDLALGALTWLAGMASDAGEVVFAVSRTAGWLAHASEEYGEAPLRYRPRSLPR
jgi:citrate synthase